MSALKTLLESSILTDETKQVLKEAWETAESSNRVEIEAEYAAKLNQVKSELISESIQMVEEVVASEMADIAEELAEARSLEIEYATKLQDFKESYAQKTDEMISTQVQETVKLELDELREDIEFAKKHQFVMDMFESYKDTYSKLFGEADLNVHQKLEEATQELNALRREQVMNSLLESVSGSKRDVIATILESVPTEKLADKFDSLKPIILKESNNDDGVITESTKSEEINGTIVMESDEQIVEESTQPVIEDAVAARLRKTLNFIK